MAGITGANKQVLSTGLRELRNRITQAEYAGRMDGYQAAMDQLTWLLLDVRKLREELYATENQEVLPIDDTASKNEDRL